MRAISIFLAGAVLSGATSIAQPCGDFDGDGQADLADLADMLEYLIRGAAPPLDFATVDVDDFSKLTFSDVNMLWGSFGPGNCDFVFPTCPPANPPLTPIADPLLELHHTDAVIPNQSPQFTRIRLSAYGSMEESIGGWMLPMRIRVGGQIPVVDSIELLESLAAYGTAIDNDSGIVSIAAFAMMGSFYGSVDVATIYFTVPPPVAEQPISIDWIVLNPEQAPLSEDSSVFPLVTGPCGVGLKREPVLVGDCCIFRGNVDRVVGAGGPVDVADVVYLINYLFAYGPPPPCMAEADLEDSQPVPEVDVADLTYLVAYVFLGGPPPGEC